MKDKNNNWELLGWIKVSPIRKNILASLAMAPQLPSELAKQYGVSFPVITKNLNLLVEKGIIICLSPNLKKGRIYALTEMGKKLLTLLIFSFKKNEI